MASRSRTPSVTGAPEIGFGQDDVATPEGFGGRLLGPGDHPWRAGWRPRPREGRDASGPSRRDQASVGCELLGDACQQRVEKRVRAWSGRLDGLLDPVRMKAQPVDEATQTGPVDRRLARSGVVGIGEARQGRVLGQADARRLQLLSSPRRGSLTKAPPRWLRPERRWRRRSPLTRQGFAGTPRRELDRPHGGAATS